MRDKVEKNGKMRSIWDLGKYRNEKLDHMCNFMTALKWKKKEKGSKIAASALRIPLKNSLFFSLYYSAEIKFNTLIILLIGIEKPRTLEVSYIWSSFLYMVLSSAKFIFSENKQTLNF